MTNTTSPDLPRLNRRGFSRDSYDVVRDGAEPVRLSLTSASHNQNREMISFVNAAGDRMLGDAPL